jgi:cytochrome c biogenesis protein CcmG/thiol:disulfide interchange protein DsbE
MRTRRRTAVHWLVALACGLAGAGARAATPAVDAPAPPFVAQTPDGARFDLAQLRGKVVLLHFWATWCDSCRTEMPALAHVYADLHARGLELLAVSADDVHERRAALDMARLHQLPAALLDAARPNGFGAPPVLPLTYVIDRGGVLRARLLPARAPLTEPALRAVIEPLLDTSPPQRASGQ